MRVACVVYLYIDVCVFFWTYIASNTLNIVQAHRHLGLTCIMHASSTVRLQAANQSKIHCRLACQHPFYVAACGAGSGHVAHLEAERVVLTADTANDVADAVTAVVARPSNELTKERTRETAQVTCFFSGRIRVEISKPPPRSLNS